MIGIAFILLCAGFGLALNRRLDLGSERFWIELSAGFMTGTVVAVWIVFVLSWALGFNITTLVLSLAVLAGGMIVLNRGGPLIGGKGSSFTEAIRSITLAEAMVGGFLLLYFGFGIWGTPDGEILYKSNYTDFAYHAAMSTAFLEQDAFPPLNPHSAQARLSYHFLVNFHSAILRLGGWDLLSSIKIPNILFAFALVFLLFHFLRQIVKKESAVIIASILFFAGHVGIFNIIFLTLCGLPEPGLECGGGGLPCLIETVAFPYYNFLSPIANMLLPQRPFLFALPVALIVMTALYRSYALSRLTNTELVILSLLVGLLPLVHIVSFFVLSVFMIVFAAMSGFSIKRFGLGIGPLSILAAGQLWFILAQSRPPWFSGFEVHWWIAETRIWGSFVLTGLVFWLRAAGLPLVLGVVGAAVYFRPRSLATDSAEQKRGRKILFFMFLVTICFFIFINVYRLSPVWGDNAQKFFLYFNLFLCLFAGWVLDRTCRSRKGRMAVAQVIFLSAMLPTGLDVWIDFSRPEAKMFSACEKNVAEWIRLNTPPTAVFLTGDQVVHYLPALGGRRVVAGAYSEETGLLQPGTKDEVKTIFQTGDQKLAEKYDATHLLVGPQEIERYGAGQETFARFNCIYSQFCQGEDYRVYDLTRAEP